MKSFNELNQLIGGWVDSYNVVDVILDFNCPEELYTMPSGDIIKFTQQGVFSDKNILAEEDVDFMSRNPSFEVQQIKSYLSETGIFTAIFITYNA